jgi:dihydrofolate reductase
MRKIIYSVATSLDGYLSGPNGEIDWMVMDPEIDFAASISRFDTILMGRKTYEKAVAMQGSGAMPGMKCVVVSTTVQPENAVGCEVIGRDVPNEIAALRAMPGKDIWLFGGGALFASLLEMGFVDTVEVAIIPALLGGGIPMLPTQSMWRSLRLANSHVYQKTGTVLLEYSVEKRKATSPRA